MAAKFKFALLTNNPERLNVITAKLGSRAGNANELKAGFGEYGTEEENKAVKLGTADNFVLCADGDELDGFIDNIDGGSTESGYTLGGVARCNGGQRMKVQVAVGATQVAIDDLVVAAAQLPVGTAGLAQVKEGTPTRHLWRVLSLLSGTGVAGNEILIEKL